MENQNVGASTPPNVGIMAIALIGLVILAFALITGYFFWKSIQETNKNSAEDAAISGAAQGTLPPISTNPLNNEPNINPAENSNPIKEIKTNPFE